MALVIWPYFPGQFIRWVLYAVEGVGSSDYNTHVNRYVWHGWWFGRFYSIKISSFSKSSLIPRNGCWWIHPNYLTHMYVPNLGLGSPTSQWCVLNRNTALQKAPNTCTVAVRLHCSGGVVGESRRLLTASYKLLSIIMQPWKIPTVPEWQSEVHWGAKAKWAPSIYC